MASAFKAPNGYDVAVVHGDTSVSKVSRFKINNSRFRGITSQANFALRVKGIATDR